MAEPSWPDSVELGAFLTDLEAVQQKFRIPAPVVVLTADLLKQVPRRTGVRNASELVAALLVRASQKAETLGEVIGDYRETRAHRVLDTDAEEGVFELPARSTLELS
jgi:hypothetical protein